MQCSILEKHKHVTDDEYVWTNFTLLKLKNLLHAVTGHILDIYGFSLNKLLGDT